jgi:hypothetical protein
MSTTTGTTWHATSGALLGGQPMVVSAKSCDSHGAAAAINAIHTRLESIVLGSESLDQVFSQIIRLILEQSNCRTLVLAERNEQGEFLNLKFLSGSLPESDQGVFSTEIASIIRAVQTANALQSQIHPAQRARQLIASPIRIKPESDTSIDLILVSYFDADKSAEFNPAWLIASATQFINQFVLRKSLTKEQTQLRQLAERWKLTDDLFQSTNLGQASRLLVNQLRRITQASLVSLAIDGKLMAISDVEYIDHQCESMQFVRAACEAGLITGGMLTYLVEADRADAAQLPLQAFCRLFHLDACVSLPLGVKDPSARHRISLLLAGDSKLFSSQDYLERVQQIVEPFGAQLKILLKGTRSLSATLLDRLVELTRHRWRKIVAISFLALSLAMAIPMPYRISCDCEVQPVKRRFVAAPFESILERTLAKNGDVVKKDQVIAQLDGRLLRFELSGLEAELVGAKKRYDTELAAGNIAQSQIAKSEMDRLKARISLLQKRFAELEIRSPIDGVIINGDLEKVEGVSLTIGQALFEIAPLDEMIVEMAIPESEIRHAETHMEVALKLNAFPYETWYSKVDSIHPRAELNENNSVFVAQAAIANTDGVLRPGMKGTAKIRSHWASLGWILFHRPWEAIRQYTIW